MTNEKKPKGMFVAGLVMAKNIYPPKEGRPERYGVDVAVTGIREMLSVTVPFALFNTLEEEGEFRAKLNFRTYKGNIYFEAIP